MNGGSDRRRDKDIAPYLRVTYSFLRAAWMEDLIAGPRERTKAMVFLAMP